MDEFIELVHEMRKAQKRYKMFGTRYVEAFTSDAAMRIAEKYKITYEKENK